MRAHVHVLSSERQGQRPVRAHVHELFSERQGQRPVRAHVHVLRDEWTCLFLRGVESECCCMRRGVLSEVG